MKKGIWKEDEITVRELVYRCPFCDYTIYDKTFPPYYCGMCGSRLYANEHDMKEGEENESD